MTEQPNLEAVYLISEAIGFLEGQSVEQNELSSGKTRHQASNLRIARNLILGRHEVVVSGERQNDQPN